MKLRHLEELLEGLLPFRSPRIQLEQYPTGTHLAACMVHSAAAMGDIEGRVLADLGCGTGVLSIAACCAGAEMVVGVDVDDDALEVAQENCARYEEPLRIDFVRADVNAVEEVFGAQRFETIIMNPPFGTKLQGADKFFLEAAFRLVQPGGVIYSLHKSSTRAFIERHSKEKLNAQQVKVVAEMRYELPKSYKFHKQKAVDIAVDFWRMTSGE